MNEAILKIEHLSKSFFLHHLDKTIIALTDINLVLHSGEFVGITGKSGSGKSTILKCIYRSYFPEQGSIWYQTQTLGLMNLGKADDQTIISLRRHEIGYISQFLNLTPRTTALESVVSSLLEMEIDDFKAKNEARSILRHFDLDEELWDNYPSTFSGGEKLRLNIARAMVKKPRLLLLDEPTASLDHASKMKVRELIVQLMKSGTTMMGIFHDLEFMSDLCHRSYEMKEGKLYEGSCKGIHKA
jgi:alpha-D-ribose 1-methylphosphonate 5-triphosphate synthase subunit PhnL